MDSHNKQILDWQEKVRASFGDVSKMYNYLFETMDNFYYRYLETSESKNLKTTELRNHTWGAVSFESSMVEALKVKEPKAHQGILELAKSIPKAQKPLVRYGMWTEVAELTAEHGKLKLVAEVNWDFPNFTDTTKTSQKTIIFEYADLAQFRKELALKLESIAELFL